MTTFPLQLAPCRVIAILAAMLGLAGLGHAQTTVVLAGGDAGQGLTLDAGNVVVAWDIQGAGATLQGVNFTSRSIANYFDGSFSFGGGENSANDSALSDLLNNGAWDGGGGQPLTFTFTGLTANAAYRFDLIQSTLGYQTREQAIVVNGSLLTIANLTDFTAYNTTFLTTASGSGEISLLLVQSGGYGGTGTQDGAVLNALVLTAVPEPATYAALAGLGALGLVLYRRRRAAS